VRVIWLLLRFYSYVVLAAVALASIAMSAVIIASPNHQVHIGWLPWSGDTLGAWLAALGTFGLLAIVLALANRLRALFLLFALAVVWLVVRGFFLTPWQFSGPGEFRFVLWVTVGLAATVPGAFPLPKPRR
jgi:hypothetical protein